MPGIYGLIEALRGVRSEVQNLSADVAEATTKQRDFAKASREAEAAETTSRITGGASGVTVKGLSAALRATAGRTA